MKKPAALMFAAAMALVAAAQEPRNVVLIVQNHGASGTRIPMLSLTDALTATLSRYDFCVINPYNNFGTDQNRSPSGERMPSKSAMELARELRACGAIMATVYEFLESKTDVGTPAEKHRYSVRVAMSLVDAHHGGTICGETVVEDGPRYMGVQDASHRQKYLGDLVYTAMEKCAERLGSNPKAKGWRPLPPQKPRPSLPPDDPWLTLSDVDRVMQKLIDNMRANPVFRSNYDMAQKAVDRVPLVIVGGLVDLTGGKSPTSDIANLLGAASQSVRMTLLNTRLFDAKDDVLVTTITKRIIENGNSPLEDGELMSALKQHGSPDFFMIGDLRHFSEKMRHSYRFRLALHNLHTGKIVWEGVETITKNVEVSK